MENTPNKLTCGFCGFIRPSHGLADGRPWTPYFRAVYCTGPRADAPLLSGLGHHEPGRVGAYYVPAESHQRFDDPDLRPASLIAVHGVTPPGPEIPDSEKFVYSWGFVFHDACWQLLVQASAPDEVDIGALWRILLSVPYACDLPNWGHNFGGLYLGTSRDESRGDHFVLLGRHSHLVIPSTFANPLDVPELAGLLRKLRIDGDSDGKKYGRKASQIAMTSGVNNCPDPFAKLPFELRELLLAYVRSSDVVSLRLASRSMASMPLSQQFFRSRFWPGRELEAVFDGFLLSPDERMGLDWEALYREMKTRLKYNQVCLGERNRLRIWKQTVKPLAKAIDSLRNTSPLCGETDHEWAPDGGDHPEDYEVEAFNHLKRKILRSEVELPDVPVKEVHVSLLDFFGARYVTGLRFSFAECGDVKLGYISRLREEKLPFEAELKGFHLAKDESGIRAIAAYTDVLSEYLKWVGDDDPSRFSFHLTVKSDGNVVRLIKAAFDGIRMQGLMLSRPNSASQPTRIDSPESQKSGSVDVATMITAEWSYCCGNQGSN
ncbi:hypothetical protein F4780DRAFT_727980 [Xylariomycetidae sp. FL0641]|nr:hypothetical protein F4780DRAFT_727980 [Xylariomycetidae sp. FL0641]